MKSYVFPDNSSKNAKTEITEKQQEQLETAALEAAFEMLAKSAQPIQIDPKKLGNNFHKSNMQTMKQRKLSNIKRWLYFSIRSHYSDSSASVSQFLFLLFLSNIAPVTNAIATTATPP